MTMNPLKRIKDLIEDTDTKQKTLAAEFDITESTMSGYMTGKVRLPAWLVERCAQHFHVATDYLYGLTDDPQPPVSLSQEERALVAGFRTLSRDQKELVTQTVSLLREQNQR